MGNFGIKIDLLKLKKQFRNQPQRQGCHETLLGYPYRRQRSLPRRERGVSEPHSR